jgi:ABC-2 type transport system permease protein
MNTDAIKVLAKKDLSLFIRHKFYGMMTVLAFVMYIAIYFLLPSTVDEKLELALYAPVIPPVFEQIMAGEGIVIDEFDTEEALVTVVEEKEFAAGIVLPADIMEQFNAGQKPDITVYYPPGSFEEIQDAVTALIRELAYLQTGQPLMVTVTTEILGPDLLGEQIPIKDRVKPLFALMIVLIEGMGLAALITEEVETGMARALLVTPMKAQDLYISKAIFGVGFAFIQAILFMALVGGLNTQPLIMLTTLLLGAIMVTGFAFLIASFAKGAVSVMGWGVVVMIILMIPAFGIMIPGVITGWGEFIPSYYLADTVHQVANMGSGWSDVSTNLLILVAINIVVLLGGITALGRKLR